jgi:hypothetical protein
MCYLQRSAYRTSVVQNKLAWSLFQSPAAPAALLVKSTAPTHSPFSLYSLSSPYLLVTNRPLDSHGRQPSGSSSASSASSRGPNSGPTSHGRPARRCCVHVLDLNVGMGEQWASLMQEPRSTALGRRLRWRSPHWCPRHHTTRSSCNSSTRISPVHGMLF